jgi:hypothetical protein
MALTFGSQQGTARYGAVLLLLLFALAPLHVFVAHEGEHGLPIHLEDCVACQFMAAFTLLAPIALLFAQRGPARHSAQPIRLVVTDRARRVHRRRGPPSRFS